MSVRNESIQGSLSVSRSVVAGGDFQARGNSTFDHDVRIKGWLYANNVNFVAIAGLTGSMRVTAKIRYSHREAEATATMSAEDELCVEFTEPQRAVTRGQTVVLYSGEAVIASATILGT